MYFRRLYKIKVSHTYYALGVSYLVAMTLSLWLNNKSASIFQKSVAVNQELSSVLNLIDLLASKAAEANGPGNDIFQTHDVSLEQSNFLKSETEFSQILLSLYKMAQNESEVFRASGSSQKMQSYLQNIKASFVEMKGETFSVFKAMAQTENAIATKRMASMDKKYSQLTGHLGALRTYVLSVQTTNLIEQKKQVKHLANIQVILAVLFLLVVLLVSVFGVKLNSYLDRQKTLLSDRESQMVNSQKLASIGSMASAIVHEINNPLSVISVSCMQLQKLQASEIEKDPKSAKYFHNIESMVGRIQLIIKGVKNLAYSTANEKHNFEVVSFGQIIDETIALANAKVKQNSVLLKLDQPPNISIECNPVQVSQVILNLVGNAVDAIQNLPDRWVHIGFLKSDNEIQVSITDSGLGISPDLAAKIMSPFFTTKERGKGSGLGLSICKQIAESHGGSLCLNLGAKNTQFVVSLPLRQNKAA